MKDLIVLWLNCFSSNISHSLEGLAESPVCLNLLPLMSREICPISFKAWFRNISLTVNTQFINTDPNKCPILLFGFFSITLVSKILYNFNTPAFIVFKKNQNFKSERADSCLLHCCVLKNKNNFWHILENEKLCSMTQWKNGWMNELWPFLNLKKGEYSASKVLKYTS